jgi:hypothetical protein
MTRFVDIILYADGSNGPLGAPLKCVEHEDEARALPSGATRMTTEEYRAQQKAWDAEWARWWAERPPEPPPPPPPPESVPAWAAKAALEEAGLLEAAQRAAQELGVVWKWRFAEATIWQRSDVLPFAPLLGLPEAEVDTLLRRAATIAGL